MSSSKFNMIVNPETGRKVRLHGPLGKKILQRYLLVGGAQAVNEWEPYRQQVIQMFAICNSPTLKLKGVEEEKSFVEQVINCIFTSLVEGGTPPSQDFTMFMSVFLEPLYSQFKSVWDEYGGNPPPTPPRWQTAACRIPSVHSCVQGTEIGDFLLLSSGRRSDAVEPLPGARSHAFALEEEVLRSQN